MHSTIAYSMGVKLAVSGPNPTRYAPFCGPRHVSFVLALGLTEIRFFNVLADLVFFLMVITQHYDLIIIG